MSVFHLVFFAVAAIQTKSLIEDKKGKKHNMKDWVKVMWHCLTKTFANLKGEDHRVESLRTNMFRKMENGQHEFIGSVSTTRCTCGYNKKVA